MSPKVADPAVRTALIETAARLLAEHVPLSTRRLAAEIGTSTTAVYTHFGSMDDLRRAVRVEGFARLTDHLAAIQPTRDPVADLYRLGWGYATNALANPHLYRAMFFETPLDADDALAGFSALQVLTNAVRRCMSEARFTKSDPWSPTLQLWAFTHGLVAIVMSGLFTLDDVTWRAPAMAANLFIGLGDDPARARHSIKKALRQMDTAAQKQR